MQVYFRFVQGLVKLTPKISPPSKTAYLLKHISDNIFFRIQYSPFETWKIFHSIFLFPNIGTEYL